MWYYHTVNLDRCACALLFDNYASKRVQVFDSIRRSLEEVYLLLKEWAEREGKSIASVIRDALKHREGLAEGVVEVSTMAPAVDIARLERQVEELRGEVGRLVNRVDGVEEEIEDAPEEEPFCKFLFRDNRLQGKELSKDIIIHTFAHSSGRDLILIAVYYPEGSKFDTED